MPRVNVPVAFDVMLADEPRLIVVPLTVMLELARYEFGKVAATLVMLALA